MTTTKTSVDHATHDIGNRKADRSGSSQHALGRSRNRNTPENAEDDTQGMDSGMERATIISNMHEPKFDEVVNAKGGIGARPRQ